MSSKALSPRQSIRTGLARALQPVLFVWLPHYAVSSLVAVTPVPSVSSTWLSIMKAWAGVVALW